MRWNSRRASVIAYLAVMAAGSMDASGRESEYVIVRKVMDTQVVIVRSDGTAHLVDKDLGCLSLFEGRRVVLQSPGRLLGVGSKLILPDAGQECRIWNAKPIDAPVADADAMSFYDAQGKATAYIAIDDGLTVYLWTGEPVAYLQDDSFFGVNGKHLGWYRDGAVYDHDGAIVAVPAIALAQSPDPARARGPRQAKPAARERAAAPAKPVFGRSWSKTPAKAFFLSGRV
jgi:hypothetical protein